MRPVQQCVEAGLVDSHLDGSLINAHASRDAVVEVSPELIAALKRAYQIEERKLEGYTSGPELWLWVDADQARIRRSFSWDHFDNFQVTQIDPSFADRFAPQPLAILTEIPRGNIGHRFQLFVEKIAAFTDAEACCPKQLGFLLFP